METKRPFLPRLREEYGYLMMGASRKIPWSRGMLLGPEATRRCRDGKNFGRQSLILERFHERLSAPLEFQALGDNEGTA